MDLDEFRAQFPITETRAYLFAGALCPAAVTVRAAFDTWASAWTHDPLRNYDRALAELADLRAAFASLIGADVSEVAITDNTSRASNMAVRLLAGRRGDVVVDDTTYPSGIYPWITLGGREVRYAATDGMLDAATEVAKQVNTETAAVVVSHVAPLTGRRHDLIRLADVAHAHGAVLIVDAAQSTGVLPLDVRGLGVDILVSTAMKWLLGPPGIGFLYVRSDLINDAPLGEIGYLGVDVPGEDWPRTHLPRVLPDARRFELGLPSLPALSAARAGIELVQAVGTETIFERVSVLAGQCIDELNLRGLRVRTPAEPYARAGVVAAELPGADELAGYLRLRGVDVGGYSWGLLRVDPHAFCVQGDLERFLEGLDRFLAARE